MHVCLYMYVCVYVFVYVHMCVHIYIHIYICMLGFRLPDLGLIFDPLMKSLWVPRQYPQPLDPKPFGPRSPETRNAQTLDPKPQVCWKGLQGPSVSCRGLGV